jgi:hypothetical protein
MTGIKVVPIMMQGRKLEHYLGNYHGTFLPLNNTEKLQNLSNGRSIINPDKLREGIVIKPMVEMCDVDLKGRLFLKQRSPEYLSK